MSILKNILGAFVEIKEDKTEASSTMSQPGGDRNPVTVANNNSSGSVTNVTNSASASATQSHSTEEYKKHFEELIEEANAKNPLFQGTDFKEFMESKTDVEAIGDEPTQYRTAFNVLKRTGLTKDRLINTAREYINVIDKDLKAFVDAYDQQYKIEVVQKEQLLQQKAQELQVLNEKIANLNNELKQMSQEVVKSKDQLSTNKNAFLMAGENKKKEIESELEKINQYF